MAIKGEINPPSAVYTLPLIPKVKPPAFGISEQLTAANDMWTKLPDQAALTNEMLLEQKPDRISKPAS
jgi:hypothetical protein